MQGRQSHQINATFSLRIRPLGYDANEASNTILTPVQCRYRFSASRTGFLQHPTSQMAPSTTTNFHGPVPVRMKQISGRLRMAKSGVFCSQWLATSGHKNILSHTWAHPKGQLFIKMQLREHGLMYTFDFKTASPFASEASTSCANHGHTNSPFDSLRCHID